jgi:hypothetical protein
MCFCEDPAQSRATRRRVLEHCADTGALWLPTHFGAPHVAASERNGDAFSASWVHPA